MWYDSRISYYKSLKIEKDVGHTKSHPENYYFVFQFPWLKNAIPLQCKKSDLIPELTSHLLESCCQPQGRGTSTDSNGPGDEEDWDDGAPLHVVAWMGDPPGDEEDWDDGASLHVVALDGRPTWWWGRLRWWRPLHVVALDGRPTWWWGRLRWWRPLQVVALDGCHRTPLIAALPVASISLRPRLPRC